MRLDIQLRTKVSAITNICQMQRGEVQGIMDEYQQVESLETPRPRRPKSLFRWLRSVHIYHTSYQKEVTDIKSWTRARTKQTKSKQR